MPPSEVHAPLSWCCAETRSPLGDGPRGEMRRVNLDHVLWLLSDTSGGRGGVRHQARASGAVRWGRSGEAGCWRGRERVVVVVLGYHQQDISTTCSYYTREVCLPSIGASLR